MKQTAIKAAKEAAKILMQNFKKIEEINQKGPVDYVTNVDLLAEKKIIGIIRKRFPKHNILSEEEGFIDNKSKYTWLIDPLDGTHNYIHHLPLFGVSIALEHKKEVKIGVIYLPMLNEFLVAEKGKGAFLNGKKISVSKTKLKYAMVGFGAVLRRRNKEKLRILRKLAGNVLDVRIFGVAVFTGSLLAQGNIDAHIAVTTNPWDIAASSLLIEEAGGKITDLKGRKFNPYVDNFVASNGKVHKELLMIIK